MWGKSVVLQIYIDDSGSNHQSEVFVLGGFAASKERWDDFSRDWSIALCKDPPIGYFKASEARRREGQFFKGWSRPLIEQRVLELTEIICKYAEHRIHTFVYREPFDLLVASIGKLVRPEFGGQFSNPYWHCFYAVCVSAAHLARARREVTPCELIFDEQGELGRSTLSSWDIMVDAHEADLSRYFGFQPTFADDEVAIPLQAADLYSWHFHAQLISVLEESAITDHIKGRLKEIHLVEKYWSGENLLAIRNLLIRQLTLHPEMLIDPVKGFDLSR